MSASSRARAVDVAGSDQRVLALGARPTVARVASWTRAVPNSRSRFVGVVVTLALGRPHSVDAVWPSWACRGASPETSGNTNGRGVGITVHVVADNVSQLLVGIDPITSRVLFIDPDSKSKVRVWARVSITSGFPLIECDEDDPQLSPA